MFAQSPDELFDVVDENDVVVGQRTRGDVHRLGLLHRAVHIFVFQSDGRLVLQKRSDAKDEYPSRWTSSASGHVDSGEDYDAAAQRELDEELSLQAPLTRLHKFAASPETSREFVMLYSAQSDETPRCHPAEIEAVELIRPVRLRQWIRDEPDQFTPSFLHLFGWYESDYERA